jgi:hypothetical protein
MAPPITSKHLELLNTEFYTNMNFFGRDKFYNILKQKYADHPSRRQIADWISNQEVNQLYHKSKCKAKNIKSSITTPNTVLAIDLVNMKKFEVRNFKHLLNGIDMGSRFVYSQAIKKQNGYRGAKSIQKNVYTI